MKDITLDRELQRQFAINFLFDIFRLITHSQALQELDLDDNLIGDLGGREILEALMDRKEGTTTY